MSARLSLRPLTQAVASSSRCHLRAFTAVTPSYSAASPSASTKAKTPKRPVSSCPAGTVLTGLSVIKDQPDPVALPDDQYPAWLWTILDDSSVKLENEKKAGKADSGDIDFLLEKKRLRAKNRADIKASNYLKTT